jgi:propanol-preferring alcohol dehydrogenase
MRAMVFTVTGQPLELHTLADPMPGPGQVLVRVHACGVCRTDLHVIDGELPGVVTPLVPGHEIVGTVIAAGSEVRRFRSGDRVGVPWLGFTCGHCEYCLHDQENLCAQARFTGYTLPGGYADMVLADSRYCFALPPQYSNEEAAPLLCAGLIGYRALRTAGSAHHLGLYGFGAAAHIITQIATAEGRIVYAFTRPGDTAAQDFALSMGAEWAGNSNEAAPELLDAAIIFAPDGALVPAALRQVAKGGSVVCAGIHMSDIPSFPYDILWGERKICSVANLTRKDGEDFFELASRIHLRTRTTSYPLERANEALEDLRHGRLNGAAVLSIR